MDIDISQFHNIFFEESFEGIESMEQELISLDPSSVDSETINTIFRAAHSIKGGAGTFGFVVVADFTHIMETVLNEMRLGQRKFSNSWRNLLLESVDLLREMLASTQQGQDINLENVAIVQHQLELLMDNVEQSTDTSPAISSGDIETITNSGWKIYFKPHAHLLQLGNDPVRLFGELASLGTIETKLIDDKLPEFSQLVPENIYLEWQITLAGNIAKEQIVEVFEWVDDECELIIEPISLIDDANSYAINTPAETKPVDEVTLVEPLSNQVNDERLKVDSSLSSSSIRVGTEKVDSLVNLVSELVITQSRLSQIGDNFSDDKLPDLLDGLAQLERNSRDMQEGIMRMRMLPISFVFNRFPRLVHDMSAKSGKKVELELIGEQTELDKSIIEKVGDPLVHLVRNSLDHGLESPVIRRAAGKAETGLLQLQASHQSGNIVIEVHDDGAGLNEEKIVQKAIQKGLITTSDNLSSSDIHELIFLPGFSTADNITDISGRGVGMDVVRKNIASLAGSIEVQSELGKGTSFIIRLPLTLAIMDGQTVRVSDQLYILPLISIIETVEVNNAEIKQVSGKGELYSLRNEYIPIIRLYDIFNLTPETTNLEQGLVIIVEGDGQRVGLFIDDLLGQQQVVIKSLEDNYQKVIGLSGATILGDGQVALTLDVAGLIKLYRKPSLADSHTDDNWVGL